MASHTNHAYIKPLGPKNFELRLLTVASLSHFSFWLLASRELYFLHGRRMGLVGIGDWLEDVSN